MRISLLHGIVETYPAANQMDERVEYAEYPKHTEDVEHHVRHRRSPGLGIGGERCHVGGYGCTDILTHHKRNALIDWQYTGRAENHRNRHDGCRTLHDQDIYGSAEHSNEPEIVNLRYALTPTFEKYGVDAVLTGHDHAYSRSKFLSGNQTEKTVTYTGDEFDEMLDKDIDYTGEGTLTVAPGNIKADTTDESEKTYLSYLTSVMDADRITETGESRP